jgi:hypothetical protein
MAAAQRAFDRTLHLLPLERGAAPKPGFEAVALFAEQIEHDHRRLPGIRGSDRLIYVFRRPSATDSILLEGAVAGRRRNPAGGFGDSLPIEVPASLRPR